MKTVGESYVSAAVNFRSSFARPDASVKRMLDFVGRALREEPKTRLVVFPEAATTGLPSAAGATLDRDSDRGSSEADMPARFLNIAERIPGPTSEALAAAARAYGIYIATGFIEADREVDGMIYNSSMLLGPEGQVVAVHRKAHAEWIFRPGDLIDVHETKIGRIGLSICYDLWFPEFMRLQVLAGCQVHINMTANQPAFGIGSTYFPIVRAAENGVYVVSANRVGDERVEGGLEYMGASSVIGPLGQVLAMAGSNEEEIVYGVIELGRLVRSQMSFSPVGDRRTDLYDVVRQKPAARQVSTPVL